MRFIPFNDNKVNIAKVSYKEKEVKCKVFEESSAYEAKVEIGFNLIAIEFSDSPFQTDERGEKYHGNQHYGYVVDITDNKIFEINLLMSDLGWGETETLKEGTEEYSFVEQVLYESWALIM